MAGPLAGLSFFVAGEGAALAHARRLLRVLGAHLADSANDGIAGAITDGGRPDGLKAPWRVARPASGTARPLGADTDAVLGEFGCR